MPLERQATLADVARVARVATSAASRALQESPRINEPAKLRVREAPRGLGYSPNRLARSLRSNRASLVGIVVPDIGAPSLSRVIKGAQWIFEQNGIAVLVMTTAREAVRETAALQAKGTPQPAEVRHPAELVVRRSCGCQ